MPFTLAIRSSASTSVGGEIAPPVDLLDLPPVLETGLLPIQVALHTRRIGHIELRREVVKHHQRHIQRVIEERAQEPHRGQLKTEAKPAGIATPLADQLAVLVIEPEEPLQLLAGRGTLELPIRRKLFRCQERLIALALINHKRATYAKSRHSEPGTG